jgi:DNA-binding GntR family transcriptional regulator
MVTGIRAEDNLRRLEEQLPLRHRIRVQLEGLITAGSLAPGTRLIEGELAERLGVSRGPVRETLQLLSNDGFVDLRPRNAPNGSRTSLSWAATSLPAERMHRLSIAR